MIAEYQAQDLGEGLEIEQDPEIEDTLNSNIHSIDKLDSMDNLDRDLTVTSKNSKITSPYEVHSKFFSCEKDDKSVKQTPEGLQLKLKV